MLLKKIYEGDLYKVIKIQDLEFEIKYGYYDEKDRYSKYNEPIPIFPDFINEPVYTKEGYPLITKMQDRCKFFIGENGVDECYGCKYFKETEDFIGICKCALNKKV